MPGDGAPPPDSLLRLVEQCLDRIEVEGPGALDRFCVEHPAQADAVRRRIGMLGAAGLLGTGAAGPPRTLGDFTLQRELGRGGMGVVYEAVETSLRRRVALKILSAPLAADPQAVARFHREARVIAGLDHAGIVKVFRVGAEAGHHWFAMELIEGTSVDRRIAELQSGGDPASLPVVQRVALVADVAAALAHAHAAGVLHRDVKPSNILLRADGRAVLTDFGLSVVDTAPHLTRSGALPGTPLYMSPEQIAGEPLDARTDVYSLGATLFQLLTLQPPHRARSVPELLRRIQQDEAPDPGRLNPALPADLVAITLKALERDRDRRYAHAGAFLADLRAFLAYLPVQARRAGPGERLRRWVRRNRLVAALAALLLLSGPLVTGLVGYLLASQPTLRAGAAKLRADQVESWLAEAQLLLQAADPVGCERALAPITAADPQHEEARVLRDLAATRRGAPPGDRTAVADAIASRPAPVTAFDWFLQGMREFEQASLLADPLRLRRALECTDRAILTAPAPRPIYHLQRADIAVELRDSAAMAACADSLAALWPDQPAALFQVGRCRHYGQPKGHREAAFAAFARALQLRRGWLTARRGLADLLAGEDRDAEALAEYEAVLAQRPEQADTLCNHARVLIRVGRHAEAIQEVERSLRHRPDSVIALAVLGHARAESGDDRGALAEFARALAINPSHHYALDQTGKAALRLGDFATAERAWQSLLAYAPGDADAHYHLGLVHAQQGDVAGSLPWFERAVALAPDDAQAHANLAASLLLLDRDGEAIPHFHRALALSPTLLPAHRGLLQALRKGRNAEGLRTEEERWRQARASAEAQATPASQPGR